MENGKKDFKLLFEQGFFSAFNFLLIIFLFKNLSAQEIAAYGVNLTALYGGISILRNLIVGDFLNRQGLLIPTEFSSSVKIIFIRTTFLSPLIFLLLLSSNFLLGGKIYNGLQFAEIGILILFIDSIRQISISFSKYVFLIWSFFISISLTCITVTIFFDFDVFLFWKIQAMLYIGSFVCIHLYTRTTNSDTNQLKLFSKFNTLIFLDGLFNHLIFYVYNLLFFKLCLEIAADVRLINIYVVNLASTIYTNLKTNYSIRLLEGRSSIAEQRILNFVCFFSLFSASIGVSIFQKMGFLQNLNLDKVLLVGTCLASSFYFIHSRLTIFYVNMMSTSRFLLIKVSSWCIPLGTILVLTKIAGILGLFISTLLMNFFVLLLFEIALKRSSFIGDFQSIRKQ